MDLTSLDVPEKRVLRALFELAQRDHPARADVLARVLDTTPSLLARLLGALELRHLVDASRMRLTLSGLAVAVRLPALPRGTFWFLADAAPDHEDDERALGLC